MPINIVIGCVINSRRTWQPPPGGWRPLACPGGAGGSWRRCPAPSLALVEGAEAKTPISSAPHLQLLELREASTSRSAAGPNDFCKKKQRWCAQVPPFLEEPRGGHGPASISSPLCSSLLFFSLLSLSSLSPSCLLSFFLPHLSTLSFSLLPPFLPSYLFPHSSSFLFSSPPPAYSLPSLPSPPFVPFAPSAASFSVKLALESGCCCQGAFHHLPLHSAAFQAFLKGGSGMGLLPPSAQQAVLSRHHQGLNTGKNDLLATKLELAGFLFCLFELHSVAFRGYS